MTGLVFRFPSGHASEPLLRVALMSRSILHTACEHARARGLSNLRQLLSEDHRRTGLPRLLFNRQVESPSRAQRHRAANHATQQIYYICRVSAGPLTFELLYERMISFINPS